MEADFFALDGDLAGTLGKALLGEEKLTLGPNQVQVWQREFGEEARFIGVMGAYRNIGAASWRAFAEVPRHQTTLLDAKPFFASPSRIACCRSSVIESP